jgi:zinc transporter, ZIP family
MPTESPHVVIALFLVVGAGAATALGAAVVFVPSLVQYANRKTLAASLGLSAGVMTYVSFVEIFRKAIHSFQLDGIPDDDAYMYATICFFGGVLLMVVSTSLTRLWHFLSRHMEDAFN